MIVQQETKVPSLTKKAHRQCARANKPDNEDDTTDAEKEEDPSDEGGLFTWTLVTV